MTKAQFKKEVIAGLAYQIEHKGRHLVSEGWYTGVAEYPYPLPQKTRQKVIEELIAEGRIERFPESFMGKFPVLSLGPNEIFARVCHEAGRFNGFGRFRPQTGGFYGRFLVKEIDLVTTV